MKPAGEEKLECVLCRKVQSVVTWNGGGQVNRFSQVCRQCEGFWALGKRAASAERKDGGMSFVSTASKMPTSPRFGDPKGPTEISASDILAAIGGIRTRGTEYAKRFSGPKVELSIVEAQDDEEHYVYIEGGTEQFQASHARAKAMKKIVAAFLNAIAKAYVQGFQEGRDLLGGLANGSVRPEDFSEKCDNVRAGKKPRSRDD